MDRCPVCRAALNGAATCRRCRAELGSVQDVAHRAAALTGAAMQALATGERARAARLLARARLLHATQAVRALSRAAPPPPADPIQRNDHDRAREAG